MMIPWICQEEEEAIQADPMPYTEHIYMNVNV